MFGCVCACEFGHRITISGSTRIGGSLVQVELSFFLPILSNQRDQREGGRCIARSFLLLFFVDPIEPPLLFLVLDFLCQTWCVEREERSGEVMFLSALCCGLDKGKRKKRKMTVRA